MSWIRILCSGFQIVIVIGTLNIMGDKCVHPERTSRERTEVPLTVNAAVDLVMERLRGVCVCVCVCVGGGGQCVCVSV